MNSRYFKEAGDLSLDESPVSFIAVMRRWLFPRTVEDAADQGSDIRNVDALVIVTLCIG